MLILSSQSWLWPIFVLWKNAANSRLLTFSYPTTELITQLLIAFWVAWLISPEGSRDLLSDNTLQLWDPKTFPCQMARAG